LRGRDLDHAISTRGIVAAEQLLQIERGQPFPVGRAASGTIECLVVEGLERRHRMNVAVAFGILRIAALRPEGAQARLADRASISVADIADQLETPANALAPSAPGCIGSACLEIGGHRRYFARMVLDVPASTWSMTKRRTGSLPLFSPKCQVSTASTMT